MRDDKDDILERCKRICIEHLNVDAAKVTPEAAFEADMGCDSLDLVELVMTTEEEFGIEISDDTAESWITLQDAVDGIAKLQS